MGSPKRGQPTKFTMAVEMHKRGMAPAEIARAIGSTKLSVETMLSQYRNGRRLGRRFRGRTPNDKFILELAGSEIEDLREAAVERNTTAEQLATAIVKTVIRDNLYRAVLDETAEPSTLPAQNEAEGIAA